MAIPHARALPLWFGCVGSALQERVDVWDVAGQTGGGSGSQLARWLKDGGTNRGALGGLLRRKAARACICSLPCLPSRSHLKETPASQHEVGFMLVPAIVLCSKKMLSCVVLSLSVGIYGFLEWGAVSIKVHSWARQDYSWQVAASGRQTLRLTCNSSSTWIFLSPYSHFSSHLICKSVVCCRVSRDVRAALVWKIA